MIFFQKKLTLLLSLVGMLFQGAYLDAAMESVPQDAELYVGTHLSLSKRFLPYNRDKIGILKDLKNFITLTHLDLSNNFLLNMNNNDLNELANNLPSQVTHLNLSGNALGLLYQFSNQTQDVFCNFLSKFQEATDLDLSNNYFDINRSENSYSIFLHKLYHTFLYRMPKLMRINFGLKNNILPKNLSDAFKTALTAYKGDNPHCNDRTLIVS